ncbi:MAG: leucine-rich repeat domain-containing protein [Oscillospiraceae bacterium]|nr:leucine-rich repeat domain-containing protein [Oscillospiraceae bacterium]
MVLALTMLCAFVPCVHAAAIIDSGTCGDNLTWTFDSNGTLTISGTGDMDDYRFYENYYKTYTTLEGYSSFIVPWHDYSENIRNVSISDKVTSIGSWAFPYCTDLTYIEIPDSVTSIGDSAFYDCTGLTDVEISNSVTSIGEHAFYDCIRLTSIKIPDSVTTIGASAFNNCYNLASVTIPDSVTSIGDCAFEYCSLTNVTIPDSVVSIGKGAFSGCGSLIITVDENNAYYSSEDGILFNKDKKTLMVYAKDKIETIYTIPSSVTVIDDHAFQGCYSLTSITIPDNVTSIGEQAFWGCSSLSSITIPDSITDIVSYTFYSCSGLTSVTIGNNVTSIGEQAFYWCRSLTSVTMGNNVASIDEWAFQATSLTDVYYSGSKDEWSVIEIGDFNTCLTNADIHYNAVGTASPMIDDVSVIADDETGTNGVNISLSDVEYDSQLITVFTKDGRLTENAITDKSAGDKSKTSETTSDSFNEVKVFIWNSIEGMKPLCEAESITIEE